MIIYPNKLTKTNKLTFKDEILTKTNKLTFKDEMFLLDSRTYKSYESITYNKLNEISLYIQKLLQNIEDFELIIDTSVIENTTTEELWEFIDDIVKQAKLKKNIDLIIYANKKPSVVRNQQILEQAKNQLIISIK